MSSTTYSTVANSTGTLYNASVLELTTNIQTNGTWIVETSTPVDSDKLPPWIESTSAMMKTKYPTSHTQPLFKSFPLRLPVESWSRADQTGLPLEGPHYDKGAITCIVFVLTFYSIAILLLVASHCNKIGVRPSEATEPLLRNSCDIHHSETDLGDDLPLTEGEKALIQVHKTLMRKIRRVTKASTAQKPCEQFDTVTV